jgi:hypothetical protein
MLSAKRSASAAAAAAAAATDSTTASIPSSWSAFAAATAAAIAALLFLSPLWRGRSGDAAGSGASSCAWTDGGQGASPGDDQRHRFRESDDPSPVAPPATTPNQTGGAAEIGPVSEGPRRRPAFPWQGSAGRGDAPGGGRGPTASARQSRDDDSQDDPRVASFLASMTFAAAGGAAMRPPSCPCCR